MLYFLNYSAGPQFQSLNNQVRLRITRFILFNLFLKSIDNKMPTRVENAQPQRVKVKQDLTLLLF